MRLWYFDCAVNVTTCVEHYLNGGLGKLVVDLLNQLILEVWEGHAGLVRDFINDSLKRLAQTRFPNLIHFRHGIFGKIIVS